MSVVLSSSRQSHCETVAAQGCLPLGANVFVAVPIPRNQISNCYSYGYNDGISVDCEQYAKLGCIRDAMELRLISCYFISQLLKSAILTNPLNLSRNANANSPGARFSKNLRKNLGET